jgi:hypothetical protein
VPTDITIPAELTFATEGQLIALFSLVPCCITLLLVHTYPAITRALTLVGQFS